LLNACYANIQEEEEEEEIQLYDTNIQVQSV
jgi:hypothetical protein